MSVYQTLYKFHFNSAPIAPKQITKKGKRTRTTDKEQQEWKKEWVRINIFKPYLLENGLPPTNWSVKEVEKNQRRHIKHNNKKRRAKCLKLETIKKQEKIIITGTIPVEVANLTKAKALIFNATKTKNHNDLTIPTIYFAELTKKYAEADKALKQKIKEAIEKSKEIKETIIILKKEIKDAALKIVKPEQKPAKNKEGEIKTNELGEVVF